MFITLMPPAMKYQSAQTPVPGKSVEDRTAEVAALEASKDYVGLEQHARGWLKEHPGDARGWRALGIALSNQNKNDEAITMIQQAITLKPDYAPAWYSLGEIYKKQHDNTKAMDCYHHLQKLDNQLAKRFMWSVFRLQ